MTILRPSTKTVAATALVALLLGLAPQMAHAQGTGGTDTTLDPRTQLRLLRDVPSIDSRTGLPATPYAPNPGCSTPAAQMVLTSMGNSSNFSATQAIAVHVNVMQQPTSFSSCLQGLISQFSQLSSLFSNGFSFSALIGVGFQNTLQGIVTNLENQACSEVAAAEKAAHGSLGQVGVNFNISSGGIAVQAYPGGVPVSANVMP